MRLPPIHHVGYVVDDLRSGAQRFVASFGAGAGVGHVALVAHSLEDEYAMVRSAAEGWGGSEPLRMMTGPRA
jgi:hypothetical protein